MSYTKDQSLEVLFQHYWKWHVSPIVKRGEAPRDKRQGASWPQIRDAIKNAPPDPAGESDLTLAEASALFSVEPRKLKGHIRDELLQRALVEGVPEQWKAEDAAALLGVTTDQIAALKSGPQRALRQFSLTPGFRSEKEKALETRQTKAAANADLKPVERAAATRRLKVLNKLVKRFDKGLKKGTAGIGKKQRVPARDLIEWANRHPVLNDWENRRAKSARAGDRGHLEDLLEAVQRLKDGTIRVQIGGETAELTIVTNASRVTKRQFEKAVQHAIVSAGATALDSFGNVIKLDSHEHTIPEALAFEWQDETQREQLLQVYTETMDRLADELNHATTLATEAAAGYERERQGEGVVSQRVVLLDVWIQGAREDEKRTREGRALARSASLEARLPRVAARRKPVSIRF
jgi:hypothetical protein